MPQGLDYIFAALGFLVEGFLFAFHLHGRDELNVLVHTLLFYACVICSVCALLEMVNPRDVRFGLARATATIMQV